MNKIVDVGKLTLTGELDNSDIDSGFDKIESDFKELENQANQTNASLRVTDKIVSKTAKTFIGLGIAGTAAITALAVKSPVLSGTMAKMEVETLKLSNTVGRQLRPVFEAIASDLIPSINKAFSDGSDSMGNMAEKTVDLVEAISDLISKDWEGLLGNLEEFFSYGKEDQARTEATQKSLGSFSEFESTKMNIQDLTDTLTNKETAGKFALGWEGWKQRMEIGPAFLIDFIQFLMGTNNQKEMIFATSDGVVR